MDVENLIDLYTDYLIVSPIQSTATGFSAMFDNHISHDKITQLLSSSKVTSKKLWQYVKPMCHEISSHDAVLIIDDSVEEKKYTDANELICWHYDHTQGKSVKGVNFMTALYHSHDMSLPVGVEFIRKTKPYIDKKGKLIYKSGVTKNELFKDIVLHANRNMHFKYVLADTWFSTHDNMRFVHTECKSDFVMALKENRLVALSQEDKENGKFVSIKSIKLEGRVMSVYLKALDFPVLVSKQVFKNGDGSTGALYLASSDVNLDYLQITTIYKKRWKVEEYHKSIKSNTAFSKSPTKTVITQTSHFIASIMAYVKLERLKSRKNKNHFAMKNMLMIKATKAAYQELKQLSTTNSI